MTQRPGPALGAAIDSLLGRQLRRIRRRFLIHGLGYLIGAIALLGAAYFLIDRGLRLPGPVRIIATLGCAWVLVQILRQRVVYPLSREFSRTDVALAIEERFPELRQRLVSALQLGGLLHADARERRNQSPAMIEQVIADAAGEADRIPADRILTPRNTLRVWGAATAVLLLVLSGAAGDPTGTGVFLQRVFGLDVAYPRATHLHLELPRSTEKLHVERTGGEATVTMAAGGNLPVNVIVRGEVPREVFVVVSDEGGTRETAMASRGGDRFRHVFRSVSGSFTFHARGGDDDRGDLLVEVVTIEPPLVATIEATLTPPGYTGDPQATQSGGGIEALVGTAVGLDVATTEPVASAELVFLESERRVPLEAATVTGDDGERTVYRGSFTVQDSDRYQVELIGSSGLTNPHPGQYPLIALPDFAPVPRLLVPSGSEPLFLLPEGILGVRAELRDDYGITSATLVVQTVREDRAAVRPLIPPEGGPVRETVVTHAWSLEDLLQMTGEGDAPTTQGGLGLVVEATDNRDPDPQTTTLQARPVQVVDGTQLAAAIHRDFRSIREEVDQAESLQRDGIARLEEIVAGFSGLDRPKRQTLLTAVEVGQSRVQAIASQVSRRLMAAFDLHVFNRMEEDAVIERVLAAWLRWHREHGASTPHDPEFYRFLATERQQGRMGAMPRSLDPILGMIVLADGIAEASGPDCVRALAEAQVATDRELARDHVALAQDRQKTIAADLKRLLERLSEWNDFQDVVQEARALRDRQRDVHNRTQTLQEGR